MSNEEAELVKLIENSIEMLIWPMQILYRGFAMLLK